MSGYRHRHRLRHMANPHCWFRRPSDAADRLSDDPGLQDRDMPAMGVPVAQIAQRNNARNQEEEEDMNMALVCLHWMRMLRGFAELEHREGLRGGKCFPLSLPKNSHLWSYQKRSYLFKNHRRHHCCYV